MTPFGYIGIDFGTSNTHFAHCITEGDPPSPETIRLGDRSSQTTCVLWNRPKGQLAEDPSLIADYGTMAHQTWMENLMDGKPSGHFGFGFKPDLPVSEQARLDAWAFLYKACEEVRQAGLSRPISPAGGYSVVVGVPAEIGEEHIRITEEVAKKAGLGDVACVEEPLGALAYHLAQKHVTAAEARAGVVVVDFGGGTLDVALLDSRGLHEPWGDRWLGGRLFDDLFYQWVSEQNGGFEVDEAEALYVWQMECRRLKEDFSVRWRRRGDELADFKGMIKAGGADRLLRNASVKEFEQRARSYRSSLMVHRYVRGLDRLPAGLIMDTPTDLFERISQTLTNRGKVAALRGRFSKVILTGGSSSWPFMRRLVAEAFGVDPERDIIMSQEPETTIGSGLALYHVLKQRNEARREVIRGHSPAAVAGFEQSLDARLDRYARELTQGILDVLMPRINKVYEDWYENGGSLNGVEAKAKAICQEFEGREAEELLKRYWGPMNTDIIRLMREHLARFLKENEMPAGAEEYIPESAQSLRDLEGGMSRAGERIITEMGGMANTAAVLSVIALIVVVVLAALKMKVMAGIVLAVGSATGPLAPLVLGGALIAGILAGEKVQHLVEDVVRKHEFQGPTLWMLRNLVIWKDGLAKKLAEGRAEAESKLLEALQKSTREAQPPATPIRKQASAAFAKVIETAIQDLGVLDQIRQKG
jgi:hypothetical protein